VKLKPDDFVGDPSDKLVQWACSGCSEFNPVVLFSKSDEDAFKSSGNKAERDAKNAPNRRASLFLFPATAKGPGKVTFPCPAWSDGTASCKKQLFPDADKRRNPTDAERTWETAKDTFGCQFYAEIGKGEKAGGAGASAIGSVIESWFEDDKGNRLSQVLAGIKLLLVISSRDLVGESISIDLSDVDAVFLRGDAECKDGVVSDIDIGSDLIKVELTVKQKR